MMMMLIRSRLLLPALLALISGNSVSAATLESALDRGALRCGVNAELAGFASANSLGEYSGFDIDICRAVASAVFNDSEAVEMIPVTTTDRFPAMMSGNFDILSRNTTWTMERNAQFGQFAGVNFYDGQGFMVTKSSGIRSALELDNQRICVGSNTTSAPNAEDFFVVSDIRYRPVFFNDEVEAANGYRDGRCKALTADRSALAAHRTTLPEPDAHMVLPEVISKEPLGPMVPQDDSRWENIVRWSLNCMINAEELGVTSSNVNDPAMANTPAIQRLIGTVGSMGEMLGLNELWCSRIIQQVGNYGEVYERHLGPDTPLGLDRGINELWTNGGLIYAAPIR